MESSYIVDHVWGALERTVLGIGVAAFVIWLLAGPFPDLGGQGPLEWLLTAVLWGAIPGFLAAIIAIRHGRRPLIPVLTAVIFGWLGLASVWLQSRFWSAEDSAARVENQP